VKEHCSKRTVNVLSERSYGKEHFDRTPLVPLALDILVFEDPEKSPSTSFDWFYVIVRAKPCKIRALRYNRSVR
jgi:hypothetical protein